MLLRLAQLLQSEAKSPALPSALPLPIAFLLLSIEVLFRMHRLYQGERGPRDDAVSAA